MKKNPAGRTDQVFTDRKALTEKGKVLHLFGRLAIDVFSCEKYLIPKATIRIKLIRSNPNFCLIGDDETKGYKVKIESASLFVRKMVLLKESNDALFKTLNRVPSRYIFTDIRSKTFIIPANQDQFIRENVFNNDPIRRIAIAMNKNADFSGSLKTNPFHYRKFGLREIRIIRGSQPLISMNTENNVQSYFTTIKSLNFKRDGPGIPLQDYDDHYFLVFDLTSTLEADSELYYPELVGSGIRLELYFHPASTEPIEIIVLGEKLSTVFIDHERKIMKDG